METIDKLVQLITDRLLENLQQESKKKMIYLIGKEEIGTILEKEGYRLVEDSRLADSVVATGLTVDSLLRISSLCPINEMESSLLDCLLRGKSVLVDTTSLDFEQYKKSAKSFLYRELMQQKAKLEKYGAQFYNQEQLMTVLREQTKQTQEEPLSVATSSEVSRRRVLVTESKLREMGLTEGDTFVLEKGMIITALAKDYLKRHKIMLEV